MSRWTKLVDEIEADLARRLPPRRCAVCGCALEDPRRPKAKLVRRSPSEYWKDLGPGEFE